MEFQQDGVATRKENTPTPQIFLSQYGNWRIYHKIPTHGMITKTGDSVITGDEMWKRTNERKDPQSYTDGRKQRKHPLMFLRWRECQDLSKSRYL